MASIAPTRTTSSIRRLEVSRESNLVQTLRSTIRLSTTFAGSYSTRALSSVNDTWDWNRGRLILYYSSNHLWGQSGTDNNGNVMFAETWIPPENAALDQAEHLIEDSYSYDALNRLTQRYGAEYECGRWLGLAATVRAGLHLRQIWQSHDQCWPNLGHGHQQETVHRQYGEQPARCAGGSSRA